MQVTATEAKNRFGQICAHAVAHTGCNDNCMKFLCSHAQSFKKKWCAEMQMRNASEILRNAGGLGESISQNSLRGLPDRTQSSSPSYYLQT